MVARAISGSPHPVANESHAEVGGAIETWALRARTVRSVGVVLEEVLPPRAVNHIARVIKSAAAIVVVDGISRVRTPRARGRMAPKTLTRPATRATTATPLRPQARG